MSAATLKTLAAAALASLAVTAQAAAECYWTSTPAIFVNIRGGGLGEITCLVPVVVDPIMPRVRYEIGKPVPGREQLSCRTVGGIPIKGLLTLHAGWNCTPTVVPAESYITDPDISTLYGVIGKYDTVIYGRVGRNIVSINLIPWRADN